MTLVQPIHGTTFAGFVLELAEPTSINDLMGRLELAGPTVLGPVEVGLSLFTRRRLRPAGATSLSLSTATERQLELGQGPVLDAAAGAAEAGNADLRRTGYWPRWSAETVVAGWSGWLSFRLVSRNDRCLGVFTVACREPGGLDKPTARRMRTLAAHVGIAVDAVRLRENLVIARDAQHQVGQAVGVLMERYDLTADQAFGVLRRYSQQQQVKLRDIAADLVATRRLPTAPEPR